MNVLFLSLLFLTQVSSQCASIESIQLVEINSLLYQANIVLNTSTSLQAIYYPTVAKQPVVASLVTPIDRTPSIYISRLYQLTNYTVNITDTNCNETIYSFTLETGPLPYPINESTITNVIGALTIPMVLVANPTFNTAVLPNNFIRWDNTGNIVWYMQTDQVPSDGFGLSEDLQNFTILSNANVDLRMYSFTGELVKAVQTDGCPSWHHECALYDDFALALNIEIVYNDSYPAQIGDTFWKWDLASNTLSFLNEISNFIPISERTADSDLLPFGYVPCQNTSLPLSDTQDWTHGNSLTLSQDGNNIVYSSRSLSTVFVFDSTASSLLYTVGLFGEFAFGPGASFSNQHSVFLLNNSQLLMFDNGVNNTFPYSRGLLLQLNLESKVATKLWEYRLSTDPDCLVNFTGSNRPLSDGNFLIDFAACPYDSTVVSGNTYVVEVDGNGRLLALFNYSIGYTYFTYRAYASYTIAGESELLSSVPPVYEEERPEL
jgi:hypothetical protein